MAFQEHGKGKFGDSSSKFSEGMAAKLGASEKSVAAESTVTQNYGDIGGSGTMSQTPVSIQQVTPTANTPYVAGTEAPVIGAAHTPVFQQPVFKQSGAEIHTNLGYNIHTETAPEQAQKQDVQQKKKESFVSGQTVIRGIRHEVSEHRSEHVRTTQEPLFHTAYVSEGSGEQFKNDSPRFEARSAEFDTGRGRFTDSARTEEYSDGHVEKDSLFIQYQASKTDKRTGDVRAVDKIAIREETTERGGGATFTSKYDKHGKLTTDVKLFKERERTDKGGFIGKGVHFTDKVERKMEYFTPEENEAAISNVDAKADTYLEHRVDKILDRRSRYSDVYREAKKDHKKIDREIRHERKLEEKAAQRHFTDSSRKFADTKGEFSSKVDEAFQSQNGGDGGGTLFTEGTVAISAAFAPKTDKQERRIFGRHRSKHTDVKEDISDGTSGRESLKRSQIHAENVVSNRDVSADRNTISETTTNKPEKDIESYFSNPDGSPQTIVRAKDNSHKLEESARSTYSDKEKANSDKITSHKSERFMTKEERVEQLSSREKSAKKAKNKEVRKAAATVAVANMLKAKKDMQNQLGDMSGQGTGDLLKDGTSGLLSTMISAVKSLGSHLARKIGSKIWRWLIGLLSPLIVPVAVFILFISLLGAAVSGVGSALGGGGDAGSTYDLDVTGDGYVYQSLSGTQIDDIITELYANYDDMTATQETILRYSLSKVGCAYNQDYHGYLNVDIFDCSSLAYRSHREAGIDISSGGAYTAAAECYQMDQTNRNVNGEMKPGDLIFWGGAGNGRYLGVYHVAIYVGKINGVDKMVEARGTSWGVVYCDVRTNNVVRVSRAYDL